MTRLTREEIEKTRDTRLKGEQFDRFSQNNLLQSNATNWSDTFMLGSHSELMAEKCNIQVST